MAKHIFQNIKIDKNEFDITLLTDKLRADKITYCTNYFKSDDPKQLYIPLNEFSYELYKNNIINATYWLEWLLEFNKICNNKNIKLICETRDNYDIPFAFKKDCIWLVWDAIYNDIINKDEKNQKILKKIMDSLLNLFTLFLLFLICIPQSV